MRRLIVSILILFISINILPNDVTFKTLAPNIIEQGESFRVTFVINQRVRSIEYPDFAGFNILGGPNVSMSSSVAYSNGRRVKNNAQYSYSFIISAKKLGSYTIAAAKTVIDKKVYSTSPVNIKVVKSNNRKSQSQTQSQSQSQTQTQRRNPRTNNRQSYSNSVSAKDLFVKIFLNKSSVYINEPVVATIKLYTTVQITGLEAVKLSPFEGFWSQEIDISKFTNLTPERYKGRMYNTGILKKVLLFPQKKGKLIITPTELDCKVQQRSSSGGRGFFDDFFGSYVTVTKKIRSNKLVVNVKELPPKPKDFYGAVGNFRLHSSVSTTKLKTNESITLKVEISGNGNLKLIEPLEFKLPEDFEGYDPKITDNISVSNKGMFGSIKYEQLIIPRHSGVYVIPSSKFVFYNTRTKRYKTLYTKEFTFDIAKGDNSQASYNPTSGVQKEALKKLDSDIRYIKSNIRHTLKKRHKFLISSFEYFLYYVIALASFFILYFIKRKHVEDNADIQLVKNKRAKKLAKRRLKVAQQFIKLEKKNEFYNELLKAIWGYLGDKYNLPVAKVNRDSISEILTQRKVSDDIKNNLTKLTDDCEYAHFAPSTDESHQMKDIYKRAVDVIIQLEQKIR